MAEATMHFGYPDATPEKVWAILQEVAERQKETDRQMQETRLQMQETDRRMKETDRKMKETDERFGKLSNRFGELAEHLVIPNIIEKFNARGFTFTKSGPDVKFIEVSGKRIAEVDILLENGDTAVAVEVKTKPSHDDVDDHVKRMEALRRYADARNDKRVFHGAVAGAIMRDGIRDYIIKNGFYVIEQTGDTVTINTPEGFKARHW
jgi:hypothetical protein